MWSAEVRSVECGVRSVEVEVNGLNKALEEIIAWQKARGLVSEVYKLCATGRMNKDFGLRDQICRAAVSAMTNIAEDSAGGRMVTLPTSSTWRAVLRWRFSRYST